ncbi:uncharacterized protein LOC131669940 [Phymastichus coffea]|uniref:uncharacterized protein LOC131669940 n=1 Tax=Phymastichus coffea TaxID=108790 RepID=UPI00273C3D6B|nr:uncharacterized protein LOC131669940 [Phymastichus coffea]
MPFKNDWNWKKETMKQLENVPKDLDGSLDIIVRNWQDTINVNKETVENVVDSVISVNSTYLNTNNDANDKLIDAKQQIVERLQLNGNYLEKTKEIVDVIFDKKQKTLNQSYTKERQILTVSKKNEQHLRFG